MLPVAICHNGSIKLYKLVFSLLASLASSLVLAQPADAPSSPVSSPYEASKVAPVQAVIGVIRETTESADRVSDSCDLYPRKKIPRRAIVIVVRRAPCVTRYFNGEFFEVLYAGKTRFVPTAAVFLSDEQARRFAALQPAQIDASADDWTLTSLEARLTALTGAMKALNATAKQGVALLKARIFDVSEYTEGTGFEATVYNSTKKTIKYVTFSVVGLNAVGDPVRDGLRGTAVPTLRGIGPIAPGETASYSKDYMWMTDVVESFRVRSIKLEYTDGSSRVVSDANSIRISKEDYEVLISTES